MARCPACHRRLAPATPCPRDGSLAPAAAGELAASAPPDVPGFTVISLLGTGGFGAVWEASPEAGGPRVAIKVSHATDATTKERLAREADAMERVGPPNVPIVSARGVLPDGRAYLAMERLSGRTLGDEMERWSAPPSISTVRQLGNAILASAAAMHARGVVHRDLKPENVFLVADDRLQVAAKLMDFGLTRSAAPSADKALTQAGAVAGTPEYMSPEQISGGDVGLRSDVYSLGVILFELVSLRLPFTGERRELEYGHLSLRPPRPSTFAAVPPQLDSLILRCLAKDPAQRLPDAGAVRTAFAEALELATTDTTPAPALSAPSPAPGPAVLRGSDRQKVALLFLHGPKSSVAVQAALQPLGGHLAHTAGAQCVGAFTHQAGDNPGLRALAAAEALLAQGLADKVILDVGSVVVKPRPNGPPRFLSPLFAQAARYPTPDDPAGLLLSAGGREMLPHIVCEPAPGRPEYFVPGAPAPDDRTFSRTLSRTFSSTVVQGGSGPLVGRDAPLRALLQDARLAQVERRARVATVLADPGIGKTHLAFELIQLLRAKVPDAELIELRAREPMGGESDDLLSELLRRTLELPAAPPRGGDAGRGLLIERLGELGKEVHIGVALLLGWIPINDPAVQALRAAPGVLRANAARAGGEALRRLAERRPVLVVLDDAQWADDAVLEAIEQATVLQLPLWTCALARPAFAESRPTWGQRAFHAEVQHLGPLDRESAGQLARHLLRPAAQVPEPVVERLVDRSQGAPLVLVDLVRGLKKEGLLRKQGGGVWFVATEVLDRLPDSPLVEWVASRELEELPGDLAAHARLASLLSAEFTSDELEGVLGTMDRDLQDAFPLDARVGVRRLKQAGLLVLHRSGRFGFRNAVMREAVAKTVAEALATRIHRAALAYYDAAAAMPDALRLPRLAWHAAAGGARAAAAATYLALAETARGRHAYLEADLLYSRALEQLDEADEDRRLIALRGRGIMRYRLGRYDGSLADLALARELALRRNDVGTQVDVMLDESMALDWLFEWRRSRELAEKARDLVAGLEAPLLHARVFQALGRSANRFNQDREAADLLRQAARIAETLGDPGYEVLVTANLHLGFSLPFVDLALLGEAEQRLERANALCQEKGDELHLGVVWLNRSCLWIARNDRERFMDDSGRVLAYAHRMGNANLERNGNLNIAYFLYWRGEFAAAEPYARRMIEIDERYFRQGGFRPDGAVLLARILWGGGDEPASRKLVEEVRAQQAAVRADGKSELLLFPNDEMLLDMITLVVQDGGDAEWEALMERARKVAQGQELIEALEVAGLSALRRGQPEGARRWWREALQVGERIPNVMSDRIKGRLSQLPG